jgi:hypothetical protein
MRLTSMQFDGGGDTLPANPPKTIAPTPLAAQEGGAIGAASMASQYKEPGKGAGMKTAKAPKAIDKSNWDKGTKVPESTVKAVKDAGRGNMGAVPQRIVKNDAIGLSAPGYVGSQLQYNAPVSKEYKEATKRVYPNEVKTPRSPSFNESSPNAKPFPKVAAPKTRLEDVKKARNEEIYAANKTAKDGKFAAAVINAGKQGAEAYGAGTKSAYQIPGTTTKTAAAQAAARSSRADSVKKAAESKPAAKIKVSQATVDAVKAQGKSKAIANAKGNVSNAEYKEAVRRIYQSPAKAKPTTKTKSSGGGGKATLVK